MNLTFRLDSGEYDSAKRSGSISHVDDIEKKYPSYLHFLYRYAVGTCGAKSWFELLASVMDKMSNVPGESRMTINLSHHQLNTWFIDNQGK